MKKPPRPSMKEPALAGELVTNLLSNLGINEKLQQYKAMIVWQDVVGPQISAHTRPVRIRDNVLEVHVDQPTWMQQLQLLKPKILKQLNQALSPAKIGDLYLKRGNVFFHNKNNSFVKNSWYTVELDQEEKKMIAGLMSALKDRELSLEMAKFLEKQLRLVKSSRS